MSNGDNAARDASIVTRALQGEFLTDIAAEYGISRERARQIVARAGAENAAKAARHQKAIEQRLKRPQKLGKFAERFGVTKEEHRALVAAGTTRHYIKLRKNCVDRGIPFELTLSQYAAITNGIDIGRRRGQYVLTTRDKAKGYVVGNVVVRSVVAQHLATRAADTDTPRTAAAEGVYYLWAGTDRPYEARRVGGAFLGRFATVHEAVSAREQSKAA